MADKTKALKVNVVSMPGYSEDKPGRRSEWEIEEDVRTLMRAQEIRADAKRYAEAKKCMRKKLTAMQSEMKP